MSHHFNHKTAWIGLLIGLWACIGSVVAGPEARPWPRWEANNPQSSATIDHSAWDDFLSRYLVPDHPSGVARVRYASVSDADYARLATYIEELEALPVSEYARSEQYPYWFNLYNAATVKLIVDNYPVDSIREIGGLFRTGPWDEKILRVEGVDISLNDVEHRIIRPIWNDPRIHYVVNCASIGCPNLYPQALTSANIETALEASAEAYVRHPRGVRFENRTLYLSSIFDWYIEDFGDSEQGILEHVSQYLPADMARRVLAHRGRIRYEYDWDLNEDG